MDKLLVQKELNLGISEKEKDNACLYGKNTFTAKYGGSIVENFPSIRGEDFKIFLYTNIFKNRKYDISGLISLS
jgi:hypothetical protein